MGEKIKKEMALYRSREIEIEELKLKIKELEIGEQLGTSGFEERVQTSMRCKNNSYHFSKFYFLIFLFQILTLIFPSPIERRGSE
jgi:hypothetical protein